MTEFRITSEKSSDGAAIVAVTGEADLYTAPELKERLIETIEAGTVKLVVDFSETTFIDSTALGVLIGAMKRLAPKEGQVSLVITDRSVRKVFEITKLDTLFPIYTTRSDALEG